MEWEVDLRASYPMIVVGLMRDMARAGEKTAQTGAIEAYVRETDRVRQQVAENYRTSVKAAKKLLNSLMFGGSVAQWKRKFKVERGAKSELAEAFEKEMRRARILIAEREIKRSGTREKKSDKTVDVRSSKPGRRRNNAQDAARDDKAGVGDWNVDSRRNHRSEEEHSEHGREERARARSGDSSERGDGGARVGDRVRTRESHQDVKWPTGPRGRLAERSGVRQGPLPSAGARGGDRGLAGGPKEEARPSDAGKPRAQLSGQR